MNLEFHYYATAALALRAGFTPEVAHRIARSAEQVDQAIIAYEIDDDGTSYLSEKTQDYVFWDETVFRDIYLPFHFIPGDEAKARLERLDGAGNPWIVTPDSPLARELLVSALRSGNAWRIGIALHAYADTWAHQNFTGRLEAVNELNPRGGLSAVGALPGVGHLQALTSPDQATEVWIDPRLFSPEIVNRESFISAARMIYRYLRTSLHRNFDDEVLVLGELAEMWERSDLDDKARAFDFTLRYDIEPWNPKLWSFEAGISSTSDSDDRARGYDKLRWLRSEIARRSGRSEGRRRVFTNGRYTGSELHSWSEAAREHRREAAALFARRLGGFAELGSK
ncbi:MAG: DUF6765 family protein [Spirochaetota bacterium]